MNMNSKQYLVTGGAGFIGSAIVRRLLAAGQRVRVLDDNSRGSPRRLRGVEQDVEFVSADIRDPQAVIDAAHGVDSLVHLAYVNGTEFFYSKPDLVLDVAVRGMINVLDACRRHGVRELVLASSSEVYQTPPTIPTPENAPLSVPDPLNPRYSYGGGKIICELMAINYGRRDFDRVIIFRPHNVYGPDMGWEHVLPQFALRLKRLSAEVSEGEIPFPIQGGGQETRAFIHIDDFAAGLMLVLEKGQHLNIYHLGVDEERSIADVAHCVAAYFGRTVRIEPGAIAAGSTLRRCPSIDKIRALGFTPQRPFREGVFDLVRWYDANASLAPST
jgi:nucleoside-diphosphate-sugar epimerase